MLKNRILGFLLLSHIITAQEADIVSQIKLATPAIEAQIEKYQDLDIFSGVVLIKAGEEILLHKAYGLADRKKERPITLETRFDIGSMNKTFTRVVVLQLAAEGALQLNDPLGKYLSGFREEVAQNVTVQHLLEHTSGLGDYHSPDYFDAPKKTRTIKGVVERARKMPLLFEPGTENYYSNTGYVLLGAIIEKATGKSYYDHVQERIVRPLGLTEITLRSKDNVPQRAHGYFKTIKGELLDNENEREIPKPDGGFHATARAIARFYEAYLEGTEILSPQARALNPEQAFFDEVKTKGGALPFAGGFPGANTVHYAALQKGYSVTVMANMDEPVAERLGADILTMIRVGEPPAPQLPAVQNVYKAYREKGVEYVRKNFEDITENFHPTDPRDLILNQVGYELLFDDQIEESIEIFTLNTELFPEVANVWDSLGEAYYVKGDKEKALIYYRKALGLQPDMPSALTKVAELEK